MAKETGETKASVGRVLNATLDAISATVRAGDKVALSKFGTFARKQRKARDGRNPLTGAALKIPAARCRAAAKSPLSASSITLAWT